MKVPDDVSSLGQSELVPYVLQTGIVRWQAKEGFWISAIGSPFPLDSESRELRGCLARANDPFVDPRFHGVKFRLPGIERGSIIDEAENPSASQSVASQAQRARPPRRVDDAASPGR